MACQMLPLTILLERDVSIKISCHIYRPCPYRLSSGCQLKPLGSGDMVLMVTESMTGKFKELHILIIYLKSDLHQSASHQYHCMIDNLINNISRTSTLLLDWLFKLMNNIRRLNTVQMLRIAHVVRLS